MRFAVVGAGRLGTSLALALRAAGADLVGYVCASAEGAARAQALLDREPAPCLAALLTTGPTHVFLTVPDAVLPRAAAELAESLATGAGHGAGSSGGIDECGAAPLPVVAHTSGATSVEVLEAAAGAGAATLVFHPLQTFSEPISGAGRFAGAAVALTPCTGPRGEEALSHGFALAAALGARAFLLPDDHRALYHAAASVASNYLVTLEYCAQRLFIAAGMPADQALALFLPLVRAALDNVTTQGPVRALTGPLSRADLPTISAHLEALAAQAPEYLPLYRRLGLYTLDLVRAREDVAPEALAHLTSLLTDTTHDPTTRDTGDHRPTH